MSPRGSVIVVLVITTLVLLDARAVGEDVLMGNFGMSRVQAAMPPAFRAALLETAVLVFLIMRG